MKTKDIIITVLILVLGTVLILWSNTPPIKLTPLSKLVKIKGGLVTSVKLESDINEGFHKGDTVYLLKLNSSKP